MGEIAWYIPVLIFLARIGDVSLGTVRMIFVIAGWQWRSALLGFVEVLIWALAVGGLIGYIRNPVVLLAYAGGFAVGTLVGVWIEQKLALGVRVVRVFNRDPELHVAEALRAGGYRCTKVAGEGRDGEVEIAYAVVKRRAQADVLALIEKIAPQAVVTVERAEHASAAALIGPRRHHRRWLGHNSIRK